MDLHFILDALKNNSFFSGALGIGIIGGIAVWLRKIPREIINFIKHLFTLDLTIRGEDVFSYNYLDFWFQKNNLLGKTRSFGIAYRSSYDRDSDESKSIFKLTTGPGRHFIIYKGTLFLFHRVEEEGKLDLRRITIDLTVFTRNKKILENFIDEVSKVHDDESDIPVFLYSRKRDSFTMSDRKIPRSMDSLFIKQEIKNELIADLNKFIDSKKWYIEKGIPYRRGYMFEGPPGTGKSSLIPVLAGLLQYPIYIINLTSISNDDELITAFSAVGEGIVVLEDLDAVSLTASRENKVEDEVQGRLTLSGLLNAIDGVASKQGRILIVTSNYPDNLDEALIRPGRIDKRFYLSLLDEELAQKMCDSYFPPSESKEFYENKVKAILPISPAHLQNLIIRQLNEEPSFS